MALVIFQNEILRLDGADAKQRTVNEVDAFNPSSKAFRESLSGTGTSPFSFVEVTKKAGLPEIRFHDLCHTCATLLLGRSVHPKIVQELRGHATIAMTLDTYSHVTPHMQREAMGRFGRMFSKPS